MTIAPTRCSRCATARREIAWSAAAQAMLCAGCYGTLPSAQYQPPTTAPVKLRAPKRAEPSAYTQLVYRIWDQVTQRTGHAPIYIDANHVAIHCPRCGDGTLRLTFVKRPEPAALISTDDGGLGRCSRGCDEATIIGALFG